MGWWGRIFGRRRADPAQFQRYVLPYPVSGVSLTPDEALQLSTVWACIDAIAKAIASCKWNIYQPNGPGRRELLENDPLAWLLNTRPNPEMTAIGFREALLYIAIPFGNAYAEIVPNRAGRTAELWPLEADRVTPRRSDSGEMVYEYLQPDGTKTVLQSWQVFHLRGPGLNGFLGENIVARAAKSLSVAAASERFSAAFFGRGAHPSGVLEFPGKLDRDTVQRLREDWAEKRQGPENAHKPLILEGGMKWTPISIEPGKSQLVESRNFSVAEICRWFGVPPHKVQHLLNATFSNIEHQSIEFVRDALTPWCRRLEQEADFKLFNQQRGPYRYTCIDTQPLLFGDALSRAQAHAVWRQNGVMSANEIRQREGLNDAGDDGDVLLVQSNLTTVQKLLRDSMAPPPGAPPALPPGPAQGDNGETEDEAAAEQEASAETPQEESAEEASAMAHRAVVVIASGALERYSRRLENRRADLSKRNGPAQVEAHLQEERARLRPWLLAECAPAAGFCQVARGSPLADAEVLQAAALVDAGEAPAAALQKVLSTPSRRVEA